MRLVDADELKKNGYRLVHQDTKELAKLARSAYSL